MSEPDHMEIVRHVWQRLPAFEEVLVQTQTRGFLYDATSPTSTGGGKRKRYWRKLSSDEIKRRHMEYVSEFFNFACPPHHWCHRHREFEVM